jgi:serine/threonine-protein kinase
MKHCERCNNFFSEETETCPNDNIPLKDFDITSLVGQTIDGKYKVESLLGMGGMGAVFRARHAFINNEVAIKVIHPELALDRSIVERFLREARAAATIDHPNAIRVSDFGRAGDMLYLVMEFIQGSSMKDFLQERNKLTIGEAAQIMSQVCAALDVAHSFQIVHRDLKPDNIMLKNNQRGELIVKVVDFGIAKVRANEQQNEALTSVGTIIGTASYMSPEQCQGQAVDHRSDIYSLGVIVFESLSGRKPFTSDVPMQVIVKHIIEPTPSLRAFAPEIPEEIEAIVTKAMEKNPANRFATAGEFAENLFNAAVELGEVDLMPANRYPTGAHQVYEGRTGMLAPRATADLSKHQNLAATIIQSNPANQPAAPAGTVSNQTIVPAKPAAPSIGADRTYVPPAASRAPIESNKTFVPTRPTPPPQEDATVIGAPVMAPQVGKKPKLLIVIDSKAIVMLLKHQLQQAGYEVIVQMDSSEALLTLLAEHPDLIIMGIEMPKVSGPELCAHIRTGSNMRSVANIPIFLYSSLSEDELTAKVAECQANGFLHKTWNMDKVVSKLSQHLHK